MDYSKLKGRIIEKVGSSINLASKVGLSTRTISLKLNNKIYFKQNEIIKICEVLDISKEEIKDYFFCYKGSV